MDTVGSVDILRCALMGFEMMDVGVGYEGSRRKDGHHESESESESESEGFEGQTMAPWVLALILLFSAAANNLNVIQHLSLVKGICLRSTLLLWSLRIIIGKWNMENDSSECPTRVKIHHHCGLTLQDERPLGQDPYGAFIASCRLLLDSCYTSLMQAAWASCG